MNAIRLLLIDNSILFREHLADGLRTCLPSSAEIEIAGNPAEALDKIAAFHPNIIGCNFAFSPLRINNERFFTILTTTYPSIPILSYGFLPSGKAAALKEGMADYLIKPMEAGMHVQFSLDFAKSIERILSNPPKAHHTEPLPAPPPPPPATEHKASILPGTVIMRSAWKGSSGFLSPKESASPLHTFAKKPVREPLPEMHDAQKKIELISIGSSTGGTEALSIVLRSLHPPLPGIVITQHIPPLFAKLLAERLDKECVLTVKEGTDGETVQPNTVYIAPGDKHMTVHRNDHSIKISCGTGPKVHSCRPSVDVLFHSVAENIGPSALGVILTGMGQDGAEGLLEMRKTGSPTLGQDEATCIVYGMPKAAWEIGAVEKQLPLHSVAGEITRIAHR